MSTKVPMLVGEQFVVLAEGPGGQMVTYKNLGGGRVIFLGLPTEVEQRNQEILRLPQMTEARAIEICEILNQFAPGVTFRPVRWMDFDPRF